ncbi:MAG: KUP/HAK/KT family potassium transporter [Collinsella sp.]
MYGDIGTSPMYVTKALLAGQGGIMTVTEEFILGALSLVIWTVTLLTTVKYVLISLKADNHGEGGIFALYSIVRKYGKWLIIPAMLGGAAACSPTACSPRGHHHDGDRGPARPSPPSITSWATTR